MRKLTKPCSVDEFNTLLANERINEVDSYKGKAFKNINKDTAKLIMKCTGGIVALLGIGCESSVNIEDNDTFFDNYGNDSFNSDGEGYTNTLNDDYYNDTENAEYDDAKNTDDTENAEDNKDSVWYNGNEYVQAEPDYPMEDMPIGDFDGFQNNGNGWEAVDVGNSEPDQMTLPEYNAEEITTLKIKVRALLIKVNVLKKQIDKLSQ